MRADGGVVGGVERVAAGAVHGTLSISVTRWRQWSNAASEPIMLITASGTPRSSGGTSGRRSTSRITS